MTTTLEKSAPSLEKTDLEVEKFVATLGEKEHRLDNDPGLEYQYYDFQRQQNEEAIQQGRLESIEAVPGLSEKMQLVIDALVERGADSTLLQARLSRLAISFEPPPDYVQAAHEADVYGWYDCDKGIIHISPQAPELLLEHTRVHELTHGLGAPGTIWASEGEVFCSGSGILQDRTLNGAYIPDSVGEQFLHPIDEAFTDSFALMGSGMGKQVEQINWGYKELVRQFSEFDELDPKFINEVVRVHYGHGPVSFRQLEDIAKKWFKVESHT